MFDRNGLEVLDREGSLLLLATASLGRVGVSSGALPTILPVNFWFDGRQIVIRTGSGTKLHAALENAVVAFEVDDFDPLDHAGWSVVVTGPAREITDPGELDALEHAPLPHWAAPGGHLVAIDPTIVTGRRLVAGCGGRSG